MTPATLHALEARLHEPLQVPERVRVLNEMAGQLQELDPARGTQLAREAIDLARATGDALGEAQALYCLERNIDSLTRLANRRQLDERLELLLRDAARAGAVVTVALADVDHLKGINDRFSHAVGDEVMRCVGEVLRAHCRLGDIAGLHGEEFMLVFRNLEIGAAAGICERARRSIEGWDWKSIHPHLRVTLSMGLASSASLDTPQGLLDAADHWLYEAKHHGRNQIQPLVPAPA